MRPISPARDIYEAVIGPWRTYRSLAVAAKKHIPSPFSKSASVPMNRRACLFPPVCAFALVSCVMPDPVSVPAPATASAQALALGPDEPAPVMLPDIESHVLTAKNTGRRYPIWVALPSSYAEDSKHRYPVVFVTDGLYSFPLVRSIRNLLGQKGRNIEDFILVGLPPEQDLSSL